MVHEHLGLFAVITIGSKPDKRDKRLRLSDHSYTNELQKYLMRVLNIL